MQPKLIEWILDGEAQMPVAEGSHVAAVGDVVILPNGQVGDTWRIDGLAPVG